MAILDWLLTRRRGEPRFAVLPGHVRRRLGFVCSELNHAEQALADSLGLPQPPRLLLVDEESAVIVTPPDRAETG